MCSFAPCVEKTLGPLNYFQSTTKENTTTRLTIWKNSAMKAEKSLAMTAEHKTRSRLIRTRKFKNLLEIQKTHSGEKPFACKQCNYSCTITTKKNNIFVHNAASRSNDFVFKSSKSATNATFQPHHGGIMTTHELLSCCNNSLYLINPASLMYCLV